jgi:hypothetical protein
VLPAWDGSKTALAGEKLAIGAYTGSETGTGRAPVVKNGSEKSLLMHSPGSQTHIRQCVPQLGVELLLQLVLVRLVVGHGASAVPFLDA